MKTKEQILKETMDVPSWVDSETESDSAYTHWDYLTEGEKPLIYKAMDEHTKPVLEALEKCLKQYDKCTMFDADGSPFDAARNILEQYKTQK